MSDSQLQVTAGPRMCGIGTAVPPSTYTQAELLDLFGVEDQRVRSLYLGGGIAERSLWLPPRGPDGAPRSETQGELLRKQRVHGVELGSQALQACLKQSELKPSEVRYLCCVTSTGLLTPGLSALLIRELGLPADCGRLDVVGMGCNAGLNALNSVAGWAGAHPGETALMVCVEICSAAYVFDGSMRTAVVNSLFGDGAAALAVRGGADTTTGPRILKFSSLLIPEAIEAMRFDWDDDHGKFSFFLDRDVPYVVGANAERALSGLLAGTGLRRSDISHWILHSGGRKVIDAVKVNLDLTSHDVRHTSGVLRDQGNMSSGSFLFSYERLLAENITAPGEYGVMMTMGPGSTIETALVQW